MAVRVAFRYTVPPGVRFTPKAVEKLVGRSADVSILRLSSGDYEDREGFVITEARVMEDADLLPPHRQALWIVAEMVDLPETVADLPPDFRTL